MTYTLTETDAVVMLEPGTTATASVIWLHGLGADGHDFVPIVPELRLPVALAARFVFPQAPLRRVTINNGHEMPAWYDIRSLSAEDRADETGLAESIATVHALLGAEIARGVPASRIVIAGFSQGGAVALHAALSAPVRLAGVMALSAYLPLPARLATRRSDANLGLPVLQCHGREDPVVTLSMGQAARDALQAAGYPVQWHTYPMQHEVVAAEVGVISGWLAALLG